MARTVYSEAQLPPADPQKVDPISLTKQADLIETDINRMMARYEATGGFGELASPRVPPVYGDFTHVQDFQTALQTVQAAEDDFLGLKASIRDRFKNDPVNLLAFLEDPRNKDEAIQLGICTAPPEPEPKPAPPGPTGATTPAPAAPAAAPK